MFLSNVQLKRYIRPRDHFNEEDLAKHGSFGLDTFFVVDPLQPGAIQPASIDLHLSQTPLLEKIEEDYLRPAIYGDITTRQARYAQMKPIRISNHHYTPGEYWELHPNRLYLATTLEWIAIPSDYVGFLHGNSTAARQGLIPHQQAGMLDPGYFGNPTLEITVADHLWVPVPTPEKPIRIAQLMLAMLPSPADPPYAGRYQGDDKPIGPR